MAVRRLTFPSRLQVLPMAAAAVEEEGSIKGREEQAVEVVAAATAPASVVGLMAEISTVG